MNKRIIPIFFTIDNNFAPFLSVAIKSLLDNASTEYFYNIHVVHKGISDENKEKILTLQSENSKIIFNEMNKSLECITDKMSNRLRADYFTLTIFFRIFIPEMFKEYDKALYLDSDICVNGDVSELYNIDLENNLLGGCVEKSSFETPQIANYFTNGVGVDYHDYINSGILILNMKELRNVKIDEKFLYLFNKYQFENCDPDQAYINAMCKGKIKYLDGTWNKSPVDNEIVENPKIVHYSLFLKPWHYDNVRYEKYFWDYASKTPFYDEIKTIKENWSEEDKKKDDRHFNKLLERCDEIVALPVTFKTVFESGKESRI
ncbi:MAG: glycosyltransferase family 8 protein [Bacilli bacterium]|nr:glycosyltransferase family 8 protein [Bacilli bacterium]